MEYIIGILTAPYVLVALFLLAVLFDHNDARGWSGFLTISAIGLTLWAFSPSWYLLGVIVGAWIPVGIAWSMWRWRRYCAKVLKDATNEKISKPEALRKIETGRNTPTIVYWAMAWPISMIEMICSDIIDMVEVLVTRVFKGTYAKIAGDTADKIRDIREIDD